MTRSCGSGGALRWILVGDSADVFLTVLYPSTGKSVISLRLSQWIWELFRLMSRVPGTGREKVLAYCGPSLIIAIVVVWVCSFILGFGLWLWPALGSGIQSSQNQHPTDLATALYYSGYTLTTLGVGDLVPQNYFWRLVTIVEAAVGFSLITASLTYLLSVYSALTKRNTFALSLYHQAAGQADVVALLVRLQGQGQFESADRVISSMSRDLLFLLESHHNYPILHYFRFKAVHYSLARMTLMSLDLVTLIKAGADQYVAERARWNRVVVALAQYMDYRWNEVAPAD